MTDSIWSTDEETSGRVSPLSAYSDSEFSFDIEEENINNLSIQEEINRALKEKDQQYDSWYKDISEWMGEFPSDKEIQNRLEPEVISDKGLQNWLEPEEWEVSQFMDPTLAMGPASNSENKEKETNVKGEIQEEESDEKKHEDLEMAELDRAIFEISTEDKFEVNKVDISTGEKFEVPKIEIIENRD